MSTVEILLRKKFFGGMLPKSLATPKEKIFAFCLVVGGITPVLSAIPIVAIIIIIDHSRH